MYVSERSPRLTCREVTAGGPAWRQGRLSGFRRDRKSKGDGEGGTSVVGVGESGDFSDLLVVLC